MELSTLLAVAVPSATLMGGLGGALINGAATRRSGARSARVAARAVHAKEQLEALAAYLDAVRGTPDRSPDRARTAYYRATLLAPTNEIEASVERVEDLRSVSLRPSPGPRPGAVEMRKLEEWAAGEEIAEDEGRAGGYEHREALDSVRAFIKRQDEAHAKGEPEKDPEPLAAYLEDREVAPDAEWARRLLSTGAARAQWQADMRGWRLERDKALAEVSLAVSELDDLVRSWVRGQR
ncbi:hypothetical protein ABZX98_07405 [Streptomyces sp. NPDC002992]|uniref:hypothetical protein n=1 Tax=Streptomyces sp. NPDC002992 TaxID=3154273 RepID=UPI0033A4F652